MKVKDLMNRAIIRRLHNTYTKRLPFTEKLEPETDLKKDCDYISPADRVSNIRRIRLTSTCLNCYIVQVQETSNIVSFQ